jgi:hypothetical protein
MLFRQRDFEEVYIGMSRRKSFEVKTYSFRILHYPEILTQSERSAAAFVYPSTIRIEPAQKASHRVFEVAATPSRTKIPKALKCEGCQVAFSLTL